MGKAYDFMAPEVRRDPYPFYAELRRDAPVTRVEPFGFWLVTRYDDVVDVLRRTDDFSSTENARVLSLPEELGLAELPPTIISSDNPTHDRLRSLLKREFTPRAVAGLETRVRDLTRECIARFESRDRFDLVSEFTIPLPVVVIAELLGIEPDKLDDFKQWSDDLIALAGSREEDARAHYGGVMGLANYLVTAAQRLMESPGDDLISTLVRAKLADPSCIDDGEILTYCALLLVAGNETTTNLIGNLAVALLENPGELEKLRADPSLVPNAVEEGLRFSSPVQGLFRRTTRDVEIGGFRIPAGETVMPMYASANRDETKFVEPERFLVDRNTAGHIAFGRGMHFCLGANLARREARVAIEELLPLLVRTELRSSPVEPVPAFFLHGPKALEMSVVG